MDDLYNLVDITPKVGMTATAYYSDFDCYEPVTIEWVAVDEESLTFKDAQGGVGVCRFDPPSKERHFNGAWEGEVYGYGDYPWCVELRIGQGASGKK